MSKYKPGAAGDSVETVPNSTATAQFIASGSEDFGFFPQQVVDNLIHVVIDLGAEHWSLRRRVFVLEKMLEESGALAAGAIERFEPSRSDLQAWEEERDIYIKRAFGALSRTGPDRAGR